MQVAGLVGGFAANVLPAMAHAMGHAVAVIVNGGVLSWNTGDGSVLFATALEWKASVAGSMANCHASVASSCRSTARGCSCNYAERSADSEW